MRLNEGQLYSGTGLKRSKQNLMNLGFFEEANLATAAGSDDKKMNINVEVKEKPTGTFSFGAGYSSVDGIVGQGSVSQSNFLGLGLKANLAASIGGSIPDLQHRRYRSLLPRYPLDPRRRHLPHPEGLHQLHPDGHRG